MFDKGVRGSVGILKKFARLNRLSDHRYHTFNHGPIIRNWNKQASKVSGFQVLLYRPVLVAEHLVVACVRLQERIHV